jgi:YihY family inner membrane protein
MKQHEAVWQQLPRLCKRGFAISYAILNKAFQRYGEINGEQCAASFAYYAFFSLFPLVVLLVAIGTLFVSDRETAVTQVTAQIDQFIPLQDKTMLLQPINGVMQQGPGAGLLGFLTLTWSSLRFFQALVIGVNRAWGFKDYNWWRLPLKNLMMVGILTSAILIGLVAPLTFDWIKSNTTYVADLGPMIDIAAGFVPTLVLFYGLLMFYKFAPLRHARVSEVWFSAFFVTIFLKFGQGLFSWYLNTFAKFNALYGVFGTIMALLFWIYFSGSVFLLGACFAAEMRSKTTAQK